MFYKLCVIVMHFGSLETARGASVNSLFHNHIYDESILNQLQIFYDCIFQSEQFFGKMIIEHKTPLYMVLFGHFIVLEIALMLNSFFA